MYRSRPLPERGGVAMSTRVIVQHRSHSLLEVLGGGVATEPGMRLVGVAHNGTEVLRLCQREHPDVALIEADPPGWDAPALAAKLRASRLVLRVVGLCTPCSTPSGSPRASGPS